MTLTCPACGSPTPERARFCPECGGRLTDADAAPSRWSRLDEVGRTAQLRLRHLGTRAQLAARGLQLRQSTRAQIASLRARQARLRLEHDAALQALGAAVYGDDAAGTDAARNRLAALDSALASVEDEMNTALAHAEDRLAELDAEVRPTAVIRPEPTPPDPQPEPAPEPPQEPWPPPDEGTPPAPAIVPEPSPVPAEEPYPPS